MKYRLACEWIFGGAEGAQQAHASRAHIGYWQNIIHPPTFGCSNAFLCLPRMKKG